MQSVSKATLLKKQIQELESENDFLKQQLTEAHAIINSLQKENQALLKRLPRPTSPAILSSSQLQAVPLSSSQVCTNCNQEVPSNNIDLHRVQCLRRFTRCGACNTPIQISQLDSHNEMHIGTFEDMIRDIESSNLESLANREAHGAKLNLRDEGPGGDGLMHVAVRAGKKEVVQFLIFRGISVNEANAFGETPLHIACGKSKDLSMVQFLISKGSDMKAVNTMGDSPSEIAKRSGFHEALLYFQQKVIRAGRPNSAMFIRRPASGGNRNQ